jgi:hypothetical protein
LAVVAPDAPLTGRERLSWYVNSSVGPKSLGAGVVSAAWGVARDSPDEYGANLRGFGKRYAIRLSGVAIGNGIEAGLGAVWDEDPRYQRTAALAASAQAAGAQPVAPAADAQAGKKAGAGRNRLWSRVGHAAKMTVMARRPDGRLVPAYARFTGIVGNNFMTNAWRVDSDSSVNDALSRSAVGVLGRFVSNLFDELWPR